MEYINQTTTLVTAIVIPRQAYTASSSQVLVYTTPNFSRSAIMGLRVIDQIWFWRLRHKGTGRSSWGTAKDFGSVHSSDDPVKIISVDGLRVIRQSHMELIRS